MFLYRCDIGDEGIEKLLDTLGEGHSVVKLKIGGNNLSKASATTLSQFLSRDEVLESLGLSSNLLGDEGVAELCRVLKFNKSLTHLDLYGNQITCKGVKEIAEMLTENKSLKVLHLGNNEIKSEGIQSLAAALSVNKCLEELYLGVDTKQTVNIDVARSFADALRMNMCLKKLELNYSFEYKANELLLGALRVNDTLTSLNMDKCYVPHFIRLDMYTKVTQNKNCALQKRRTKFVMILIHNRKSSPLSVLPRRVLIHLLTFL